MSQAQNDPLTEVDAVVQAYLGKQVQKVDADAGLARVRAAQRPAVPFRRRVLRLALTGAVAAAVVLAFLGGMYLGPVHASAKELVQEARRVHDQSLERCYAVEIQLLSNDDIQSTKIPKQVQVWTRGDRFWVSMKGQDPSVAPFVWGRTENGALWAVLDSHRGVRVSAEKAPRPLALVADVYSLNLDTLLDSVLSDCTLTELPATTPLTRVVHAEPTSEATQRWLASATLEIDTEAKVVRRLLLDRNRAGVPWAKVTFTLTETRPADDSKYQLEGHLASPFRIHEENIEPRVKLELLKRWASVRSGENRIVLTDVNGKEQTPLSQPEHKATVLFFLLPDCPVSNAYAPEIKRICDAYEPKKVAMFVVHADPDVTPEIAKKHAKEFGMACPVVCDPGHVLVKRTGVTMAPEVAVLGPDTKVLYRGRIDDLYADYGKRRSEPTQRDLRNALDAVLAGRPVATPTTKVIGCPLPEARK
jgi:hypothetical protein